MFAESFQTKCLACYQAHPRLVKRLKRLAPGNFEIREINAGLY